MRKMLERCYKKNPDIVFRKVAGEYLLVPIKRQAADIDSIYTLNELAARIWDLIDGKTKVNDIKKIITEQFQVSPKDAERDLREFLQELESIGCVRENNEVS